MTIAHDATTAVGNGTGTISATHTPVGTPKGVFISIVQNVGTTNEIDAVTYGGVACALAKFESIATGEPGASYIYHLGASIPTGAQTASVTVTGASAKVVQCQTVTAATDTRVCVSGSTTAIQADPAVALSLASYRTCYAVGALFSGQGATTGIAPATGYTDLAEHDFGAQMASFIRIDAQDAGGGVTVGWVQTSEEGCGVAAAIEEITTLSGTFKISGVAQSGAKIDVGFAGTVDKGEYAFSEVVTTDGSGAWSAIIPKSAVGFANGSYNSGGTYYTAPSQVFLDV